MLLDTKTLEEAYTELEAELARVAQYEHRLANELAHVQDQNKRLWDAVTILYRQSMPFRCDRVKRILPELARLDHDPQPAE